MAFQVLLQAQQPDLYTATAVMLPHVKVNAPTRQAAIEKIRFAIQNYLNSVELIEVETDSTVMAADHATYGMLANDPMLDQFLAAVEAHRAENNVIEA